MTKIKIIYIFGFCSGFQAHSFPKPQNFLSEESHKDVFCYVDVVTVGPHLRMGAGFEDNQPYD